MAFNKVIFITSGTTFTVPSDFVSLVSVEGIGGGGNGFGSSTAGNSGGGGAYAYSNVVTGLTAGGTAYVSIGAAAGDTWFNASTNAAPASNTNGILAKGGNSGGANAGGAAGGDAASCVGTIKYSGGAAGLNQLSGGTGYIGGGGGAAGPGGAGGAGGNGTSSTAEGGGGSGATLTLPGNNGTSSNATSGGAGANSPALLAGGGIGGTSTSNSANAMIGTGAGGGGGYGITGTFLYGGLGANGTVWFSSTTGRWVGPGGGAGGGGQPGASTTGLYGGGGGGIRTTYGTPSSGAQGIIIFTYVSNQPTKTVFITSGSTYTLPSDVDSVVSVEVIGGGGGGNQTSTGGGGGAYANTISKKIVLSPSPGNTVAIAVGAGGAQSTSGGDTYFGRGVVNGNISGVTLTANTIVSGNLFIGSTVTGTGVVSNTVITAFGTASGGIGTYIVAPPQTVANTTFTSYIVLAKAGAGGSTGLQKGGNYANNIPAYSGFSGGDGGGSTNNFEGGGGGAAGPGGVGGNAANGTTSFDGGGGGGASLTSPGGNAVNVTPGNGGNGGGGTGGGAGSVGSGSGTSATGQPGTAGTGGGGGGSWNWNAGAGGTGSYWTATTGGTAGSGGGGGGGYNGGGAGGLYGGGGGGDYTLGGGVGAQGIIVLTYAFNSNTYYWVGGSGTWSNTSNLNWSTTSGGTANAGIPNINDTVIFDNKSGIGSTQSNVVIRFANCLNMTVAAAANAVNLQFGSSNTLTITGNVYIACTATPLVISGTNTSNINFSGTSFLSNTSWLGSIPVSLTINTLGTVTLTDNVTSTGTTYLNSGTLNLNNYTLTTASFQSLSGTRGVDFGSTGKFNVTGSGVMWNATFGTGTFTYTGTPTVNINNNSATAASITMTGANAANALNFNFVSGTYTLNQATAGTYGDLNFTGFSGSYSGVTTTHTVFGNLTLSSAMTYTGGTGAITFGATSPGKTITTAGKSIVSPIFNGVGGSWTLQDGITTTGAITLSNGSLNTNNQTITAGSLISSGASARTLTLGNSSVTLSTVPAALSFSGTNFSFNANNSNVIISGTSPTFDAVGYAFNNVAFTGTSGGSILLTGTPTSNITFGNLWVTPSPGYTNLVLTSNITIAGTLTAVTPSSGYGNNRIWIQSNYTGTPNTITAGAVNLRDVDFSDIIGAGAAAPFTGTRIGDARGNQNITFDAPKTVYWGSPGSNNWSQGFAWSSSAFGGSLNPNQFPLPQDTAVINDNNPASSSTITIDKNWNIGTIDMSGRTVAMTLATGATNPKIYGDWKNGIGPVLTGTGLITFSGRNTQNISGVTTYTQPMSIDSLGGTINLVSTFISTATGGVQLANGTFKLNSQSFQVQTFSYAGTNGTGTATLDGTGSNMVLQGTGTIWNAYPNRGLTLINVNIINNATTPTSRTFIGGGLSYYGLSLGYSGANTTYTIANNNTFGTLAISKSGVGSNVVFTSGTTQTVNTFSVTSSTGNLINLYTTTGGASANINFVGANAVANSMDYITVKDLNFTPASNATQPYVWYSGTHSRNNGNVTGMLFQPATVKAYLLTTGTSWTVPSDWNSACNSIYLIGGGASGGSAKQSTTRTTGSGGGGGGFTLITNFNTTPGNVITYQIGAGGARVIQASAAGNPGANGGNTIFNSVGPVVYFASGGIRGLGGQTTANVAGGAGGIGQTYNGGAGGTGSNLANNGGGGGGGGAGGPNGNGGTGGAGYADATVSNGAGGGGGGNGGGTNGGNATVATGGTAGLGYGSSTTVGAGGAGSVSTVNPGKPGLDILNTVGGGGGGGGVQGQNNSGDGGLYGGGGSGGGNNAGNASAYSANGAPGVIVISYTPASSAGITFSNFFLFF